MFDDVVDEQVRHELAHVVDNAGDAVERRSSAKILQVPEEEREHESNANAHEPDDEEEEHVLGSQAQLWTEYMPNPAHVERMAFPRLCALSEVLWTKPEARDYQDFLTRLEPHLEKLNVNHFKSFNN